MERQKPGREGFPGPAVPSRITLQDLYSHSLTGDTPPPGRWIKHTGKL